MEKKLPNVFVNNKAEFVNGNNKSVYYSFYDNKKSTQKKYNSIDIRKKINDLFDKSNYTYKVKVNIAYLNGEEREETIVSKNYDYLLNIKGERIMIDEILDIN